jgi:hypothetical protein
MANETNLTPEQMAARIAELEGRLAKGSSLSFKVSEKGGVSVYGLAPGDIVKWYGANTDIDDRKCTEALLAPGFSLRGLLFTFCPTLLHCQ